MEVINAAGVKQIDHLIITHYHVDHIGGLEELAKRIEIKHYIDHGPTVEEGEPFRYQLRESECPNIGHPRDCGQLARCGLPHHESPLARSDAR